MCVYIYKPISLNVKAKLWKKTSCFVVFFFKKADPLTFQRRNCFSKV